MVGRLEVEHPEVADDPADLVEPRGDGAELAGVDPEGNGISRWRGTNRYDVPLDASAVGNQTVSITSR